MGHGQDKKWDIFNRGDGQGRWDKKGYYPDRGGVGMGEVHVGIAAGSPDMVDRSLILTEDMISQWLKDHRAEYNSATETIKACMTNFRLHRRHRKLVWGIYSRTDFSHLKVG